MNTTTTTPPTQTTTPASSALILAADRIRADRPVQSEIVTRYQDDGYGLPLLVVLGNYSVRKGRYRDRDAYHVEEIPSPLGRAFLLHRTPEAIEWDPDHVERYGVLLGNDQDRVCECKGFAAHSRCKHVSALAALLAAGHIDHPGERPATPDEMIVAPF